LTHSSLCLLDQRIKLWVLQILVCWWFCIDGGWKVWKVWFFCCCRCCCVGGVGGVSGWDWCELGDTIDTPFVSFEGGEDAEGQWHSEGEAFWCWSWYLGCSQEVWDTGHGGDSQWHALYARQQCWSSWKMGFQECFQTCLFWRSRHQVHYITNPFVVCLCFITCYQSLALSSCCGFNSRCSCRLACFFGDEMVMHKQPVYLEVWYEWKTSLIVVTNWN